MLATTALAVVVLGLFLYAYTVTPVPSASDVASAQATILYYSDGRTELDRLGEINRESVPLSDVPVHVQRAVLAAEDRGFYSNPGISLTGMGRALWASVSGGPVQGGSTITQQYVKNSRLTQEQTLSRKLREFVISLKIERESSKEEILENYLNTIYYGRGAYGIQTAAKAYFGKNVADLDVAEGALLAAVVRGPSLYDPGLGRSQERNARERFDYVLDGMVSQGWLSNRARKRTTFPTVTRTTTGSERSGPNGYLAGVVRAQLSSGSVVEPEEILRGGLRVVTTIDKDLQRSAVEAVDRDRPSGGRADGIHVALASVRPEDGSILALYGGKDYSKQQFNDATQGHFQAGSTFKVFTLVAALQKGIDTATPFDGRSPVTLSSFRSADNPQGTVQNFGGHSYGILTLKQALAVSSNTVFATLNADVGPENTSRVAEQLGLPADRGVDVADSAPGLRDNAANVFGTAAVRPVDMAEAYATLAAGGVHTEPSIVRRVTSAEGEILFEDQPRRQRVIDESVAADTVDAMAEVLRSGTASGGGIDRPAAGKTGTTTQNKAVWFAGFTPQVSTAVAMYLPDAKGNAQPMRDVAGLSELTGGTYPLRIWQSYMRAAHENLPVEDFPPPTASGPGRQDPAQAPSPYDPQAPSRQTVPTGPGSWPSPDPFASERSAPPAFPAAPG